MIIIKNKEQSNLAGILKGIVKNLSERENISEEYKKYLKKKGLLKRNINEKKTAFSVIAIDVIA